MAGEPYNFYPATTTLLDSDIALISRSPHTAGLTRKFTFLTLKNYVLDGLGTMAFQDATAVAITGGTIDGTSIGATTPSTVKATTLTATSLSTAGVVHNSALGLLSSSLIVTADVTDNNITNAKLAQMPANTFKGNNTGSTANAQDLTISQMQTALGITTTTALTSTFVGFGSASNVLTGTSDLTWSGTTLFINGGIRISALTAGVVHSDSSGNLTNSLIVNSDITNATITGAKIVANTITNSNLATMPTMTFKANNTGGASTPLDITVAQAQAMLGISGGITIGLNQVGYGTAANNINGSNNFTFDPTTGAVNIGGGTAEPTALLQLTSTTKLLFLAPMTSSERLLITPGIGGGICFDTDLKAACLWNGTAWSVLG
jgi:hypothetical protein